MNRSGRKSCRILALLGASWMFLSAGSAFAADLAILRNGFAIRHDHHKVMGETTRLYVSADDSSFTDVATADIEEFQKDLTPPAPLGTFSGATSSRAIPGAAAASPAGSAASAARAPVNLNEVVNSASATYHLDPDLVNSVIHAESGFNVRAVSPKGAKGLMQLMPQTANALGVKNAFDPQQNIGGGSQYLRELLERYNFDLVKALAAYNAGPERVEQYRGVPPFHETRAYVARIVHDYNKKKIAQEKAEALERKKAEAANAKANGTASSGKARQSAAANKTSAKPATQKAVPQMAKSSSSANSSSTSQR